MYSLIVSSKTGQCVLHDFYSYFNALESALEYQSLGFNTKILRDLENDELDAREAIPMKSGFPNLITS